jgi:hypothetical protein
MFPISKYDFYTTKANEKIAVSTYAGKTVRGVAICHPDDNFNLETGKLIAAARCNEKVAEKRLARASNKAVQAGLDVAKAQQHQKEMQAYYNDAYIAYNEAAMEHDQLIASLRTKTVD